MSSRGRTVAAVFCFVLGLAFWAAGGLTWFLAAGDGFRGFSDSGDKEPYCIVQQEDAVCLGDTYEGIQAQEGYEFYELTFSVTNQGERESYRAMPSLYYYGSQYDDVMNYWETEEESQTEPLFYGYMDVYLPAGRTGRAAEVVQVKKGVTEFSASYYPTYSDEELSFQIKLPSS